MGAGGHNNTEINPVFRGMVRPQGRTSNQRKLVISIGIKELLDAGVHFGHQTKRWNPKMKPFIFDARNGIHIIDLSKTLNQLEAACNFLAATVGKGGKVLFVGTKKQAQQAIKDTAKEGGQFYVTERWLGGTLTNFATIKRSIARLKEIQKMEADGTINNYVKQEQSVIRREAARLVKFFEGCTRWKSCRARCSWWISSASTTPSPRPAGSRFPSWPLWIPTVIPTWWIIRSPATMTPSARCG